MKRISAELISSLRSRIRGFDWNEVAILVTALVAFVCSYLVIELADEVKEGSTQTELPPTPGLRREGSRGYERKFPPPIPHELR